MNEVAAGPRFFFFFPFLLPTNFPLRHLSYPFPQKQVKQLPIHGRDSSSNVFSAQKKKLPPLPGPSNKCNRPYLPKKNSLCVERLWEKSSRHKLMGWVNHLHTAQYSGHAFNPLSLTKRWSLFERNLVRVRTSRWIRIVRGSPWEIRSARKWREFLDRCC